MIKRTPAKEMLAQVKLEKTLASKIPYSYLVDNETIETKSGHLLQVIKIDGLHAETLDSELIDHEKHIRNFLWLSLADSSTSLYFHTIRKQENRLLTGTYDLPFANSINETWLKHQAQKSFFVNEFYITIVKKPPAGKIRRLADIWQMLTQKADEKARALYRDHSLKDLNKITNRIAQTLAHYGASKLRSRSESHPNQSPLLSFLSYLINLNDRKIALPLADLSSFLPYKRLFFNQAAGTLALRDCNNHALYAAILSIKDYRGESAAGCLDNLLDLPTEMVITQSFSFLDKRDARAKMEEKVRNQAQSDDGSTSDQDKIMDALNDLGASESVSGEHHLTVLLKAENETGLETQVTQLDAALNQLGMVAVREDRGLEAAFFASLPGNHAYIARRAIISSKNLSGFASFHTTDTGRFSGNHWGEAVTILETLSGAPFFFNFHVLDVGSTFLVGPQGSGKTALEAFLDAQSAKFGGRSFYFDKDKGLEIYIRAQGGFYSTLTPGIPSGFAPFQMEDTLENRAFLIKFLRTIATIKDDKLTDDEDQLLKSAIDINFELPKEKRIFRNLVPTLGMRKSGSLRMRFESWVNGGEYAWAFDNEVDQLLLDFRHCGFDITRLLNEETVSIPIHFYLFHRLEQKLDGTRTRIILAEGWRALEDETFREKIRDWSSTPRKKEALLIVDTQSPEDLSKSEVGCKVIQESATQIYFANPQARAEQYIEKFRLTEKEFEIVRTLDKGMRFFLLKQGKRSAVVRADLSCFKNEMAVFSGRTKYSEILDRIRKERGDHPDNWLPPYYEAIRGTI